MLMLSESARLLGKESSWDGKESQQRVCQQENENITFSRHFSKLSRELGNAVYRLSIYFPCPFPACSPVGQRALQLPAANRADKLSWKMTPKPQHRVKFSKGKPHRRMRTHLNTRVYSLPFNDVQRWIEGTSDSLKDEAIDSQEIDSDETQRAILCFLHASSPWTVRRFAR